MLILSSFLLVSCSKIIIHYVKKWRPEIISPVFCENVYVLWRTSSRLHQIYIILVRVFFISFLQRTRSLHPNERITVKVLLNTKMSPVTKLLMVLASVRTSSKGEVMMCLDSFTKFRSVWDEDKEKAVAVSVCFRFVFCFLRERFSNDCRRTNTKVIYSDQSQQEQTAHHEPIRIPSS